MDRDRKSSIDLLSTRARIGGGKELICSYKAYPIFLSERYSLDQCEQLIRSMRLNELTRAQMLPGYHSCSDSLRRQVRRSVHITPKTLSQIS